MIYCVGNNNYDIFFGNGRLSGGSPGGSMLNVAVSLGRMALPVTFLTRLGDDQLAGFVRTFLEESNVATNHIAVLEGKKTSLALAILDKEKKPQYSFYGSQEPPVEFQDIRFAAGDMLVTGSSYAIQDTTWKAVDDLMMRAGEAGTVRVYDPNIRKKCIAGFSEAGARAMHRIDQAEVVKMSDEDLHAIGKDIEALAICFPEKPFILTRGSADVIFRKGQKQFVVKVPSLKPVNTTGAGDAFNAGMLSVLHEKLKTGTNLNLIPDVAWKEAIERGINTAAQVCLSKDNFIPKQNA
jgi:fructokinase